MNFVINEGVKPGTVVVVSPDAKASVPTGKPLFTTLRMLVETEELEDGRYRMGITELVKCNAAAFEGFTVVRFE